MEFHGTSQSFEKHRKKAHIPQNRQYQLLNDGLRDNHQDGLEAFHILGNKERNGFHYQLLQKSKK